MCSFVIFFHFFYLLFPLLFFRLLIFFLFFLKLFVHSMFCLFFVRFVYLMFVNIDFCSPWPFFITYLSIYFLNLKAWTFFLFFALNWRLKKLRFAFWFLLRMCEFIQSHMSFNKLVNFWEKKKVTSFSCFSINHLLLIINIYKYKFYTKKAFLFCKIYS